MSLEVLAAGSLTTVQDLGRPRWQHLGVSPSGAMDWISHTLANWLVGNDANAATLEMTLQGAQVRFHQDAVIALCGGRFSARISEYAVPLCRPVWVRAGSVLECGRATLGARLYLAVAGGIAVPEVLQSRSTNLMAQFGGWNGRALQKGDVLPVGCPSQRAVAMRQHVLAKHTAHPKAAFLSAPFFASPALHPIRSSPFVVRVICTPHFERLAPESQAHFLQASFFITADSNRMGYRLRGPRLQQHNAGELYSSATVQGAIQVPPDGHPIVLLADRQTVGGYPIVAVVASVDLPSLAQAKPHDTVRFEKISHDTAQHLLLQQWRTLQRFKAYLDALLLR